ncbi:GNAT family N-acetyltransferase [Phytomonospora sp. NPDC050363]|uniref:GNAT family N-acetyltransferase n=1 Tax=Phytomonospora sp. NPDC050363 TaxID=3155642 RepID=UPI00340B1268
MRLIDLDGPGPLLDAVHRDVLSPSFPPAELEPLDSLRAEVAEGRTVVSAVLDAGKRPVAAAVGHWSPQARVQLLSHLAVLSSQRGTGVGRQLLGHVLDDWRVSHRPCLILAEVEHPEAHGGSDAHGDPLARLRFYARFGAMALDLPYFQPALAPGGERMFGMLLLVLHIDPELMGEGAGTVSAVPLRAFMIEYLAHTEGTRPESDPSTVALFGAIDQPGGVPVLPVDDPKRLPVSTPG